MKKCLVASAGFYDKMGYTKGALGAKSRQVIDGDVLSLRLGSLTWQDYLKASPALQALDETTVQQDVQFLNRISGLPPRARASAPPPARASSKRKKLGGHVH